MKFNNLPKAVGQYIRSMTGESQKAAVQRRANRARHGKLKNKTGL
jgi:hypothetical protein